MNKTKLTSWGNNREKEVVFTDIPEHGTINVGNQNSYGDCFFPKNANAFKNRELQDINYKFNSSMTMDDLITKNRIGLYGVPGKRNVTLGGAIASDTHGKDNIWGGSFARNIKDIYIQLPNNEKLVVSRDKDFDIFQSTIGGYGLTGSILGCSFIDDLPKYSNFYNKSIITGNSLEELLSKIKFQNKVFTVCWIDLLSNKKDWVIENFEENLNINKPIPEVNDIELKISLPFIGKNIMGSMSLVNKLFFYRNKLIQKNKVDIQKVLYPLGFLTDTRNIASNRKIVQVQFSIPNSEESHLDELINYLIFRQNPVLCSIKKLSNSNNYNNLSFHQNGWTVAVDFPFKTFNNTSIRRFYKKLIQHQGKIYLAKDSTLTSHELKEMYPNYKDCVKIFKKIDPKNIYQSELSNRLELKTW
tara:strand:- start:551 stop:1795 length:1245 start_codon:yes stop_codon:yes gene_type:complete